jgi:hypothetical protein
MKKLTFTNLIISLKKQSKYEEIVKEQEKYMRRTDKHYNAYAIFQKMKENVFTPLNVKILNWFNRNQL